MQGDAESAGSVGGVGGERGGLEAQVFTSSGLRSNMQVEATCRNDMT